MTKTDAWMPLWIGAYLADTQHLSRDEHGGYLLLLMAYWRSAAPLPNDDKRLAAIAKATPKEWKALRPVLAEFFAVTAEIWTHKRVEIELASAGKKKTDAVAKAAAAAAARWAKEHASSNAPSIAPSSPQALLGPCPTPSPTPSSLRSEEIPAPPVLVASPSGDATPGTVVRLPERRIPCPADDLLATFHEACPTLPRVMKLNANRRTHLTARWREVDADSKFESAADGVGIFKAIFERVNASDFLAGRAKTWHATFDWLIQSSNFLKVCEGHYDNGRRHAK